jgi:hypothetical protein
MANNAGDQTFVDKIRISILGILPLQDSDVSLIKKPNPIEF